MLHLPMCGISPSRHCWVIQVVFYHGTLTREFEDYLACGRLENGFLRVRRESCSHERLVAFSCKRHGFCTSCGATTECTAGW